MDVNIKGVATTAIPLAQRLGWMRGASFDGTLIIGVAALALFSGWLVVAYPSLFPTVLFLDLWLLGYHHVVATFTRLTFDVDSFREYRFLVIWLPIIIVIATIVATLLLGQWIIATTYLYWQWFHYTRQSYGIARIYLRKSPSLVVNPTLEKGIIYFLPICGILYRSYQNPSYFLGLELKCLPVSSFVIVVGLALSMAILVLWVKEQVRAFQEGRLHIGYTLYMISHLVIFTVGYLLIDNINEGWLVLNVWHNAQYVIFVWMYNNNRFKNGIEPEHRFLSTISQRKNIFLYYTTCLLISTALYMAADKLLGLITFSALPWVLIVYQTINFHHYVADAVIWRIRRKPIRQTLGIRD